MLQIHLLFDFWIAHAQCLNFGIVKNALVYIVHSTHRGFFSHILADELLLLFNRLVEVGIEGVFGNIFVDVNYLVVVTPPQYSPLTLRQINRTDAKVESLCSLSRSRCSLC